ncbi:hypothetical protein [Streptomyces sp. AC495_CC817]|uniref:hypothetical protein n=1 Tax=Streptomyces sp. AC495_CC817 TaxID=2823900 RepID=UPI001C275AF6|nr:hypothetical protein [Streptomyces sp. AC495_CC817]
MTERLALICDDDGNRVKSWVRDVERALGDGWAVAPVTDTDLAALSKRLADADRNARDGASAGELEDPNGSLPSGQSVGEASLVILDFDLTPSAGATVTDDARTALRNQKGEILARQLRAHTSVGAIIVANRKFSRTNFDLSLWTWSDGVADAYIAGANLRTTALWTGQPAEDQFNPWYWPALNELLERDEAQEFEGIEDSTYLFEWLGVSPANLEPEQLDAFAEFPSPVEVQMKDLATSPLGQLHHESHYSAQTTRAVYRSVLRRWVQRILVPPQNVLVDLPHIAQRFPLLLDDPSRDDEWQSLCVKYPDAPIPSLLKEAIHQRATRLCGRPIFHIDAIRSILGQAVRKEGVLPYGFAEDVSMFYPAAELDEFTANVPGPHFRRYVRSLDRRAQDVLYAPAPRRAMSS